MSRRAKRGGERGLRTDLGVDELGQCADELGRGVYVRGEAFFVDVFADGVPEGRFQALFLLG